jgi:hypothetical protein
MLEARVMEQLEDEVPIEEIADDEVPDRNTDDPNAPVDEYDSLDAFDPATGWPEPGFVDVAFPPPDDGEGVS